jgi:hypothetical protein
VVVCLSCEARPDCFTSASPWREGGRCCSHWGAVTAKSHPSPTDSLGRGCNTSGNSASTMGVLERHSSRHQLHGAAHRARGKRARLEQYSPSPASASAAPPTSMSGSLAPPSAHSHVHIHV